MTIRKRKVGKVVYLEQYRSYREGGKVKTEFVKYLGKEDSSSSKPMQVNHLIDQIRPSDSSRAGDVSLLWSLAQNLQIPATIDKYCNANSAKNNLTPGILLTLWAINRVIDPESATQLGKWVQTTDLPRLAGVPADAINKDAFLSSLDAVCDENKDGGNLTDVGQKIETELYRLWREEYPIPSNELETLAYDLTSIIFFGVTCPLAELGYNPDGADKLQINVALLVTKHEHIPVAHSVYEGSRHGVATVKNFLSQTTKMQTIGGTLIWDRGMVSKENVEAAEELGWNIICGLPKSVKTVYNALEKEVPFKPETLVRYETSKIYAIESIIQLYGKERRIIIYKNSTRATNEADERNAALAEVSEKLSELQKKGAKWSEAELHNEIQKIVGSMKRFLKIRVKRKGEPRIEFSYRQSILRNEEKRDGKWALLVTNPKTSVTDAVKEYLEKDFIEKGFRTMKTNDEFEPVRHRLERRVRAYVFVQVLALKLRSTLRWIIENRGVESNKGAWGTSEELLRVLGRVERLEVTMGNSQRTWYLNLLKKTKEQLKKIGYGELFEN